MNAPMVAIAVSNTMLTRPIRMAPPKIVPLETSSAAAAGVVQQITDVAVELAPHAHAAEHQIQERHGDHPDEEQRHREHQRHLQGAPRIDRAGSACWPEPGRAAATTPGCGLRFEPASSIGRPVPGRRPVCVVRPGVSDRTGRVVRWRRHRCAGSRPAHEPVPARSRVVVSWRARRRGARDEPAQASLGVGGAGGPADGPRFRRSAGGRRCACEGRACGGRLRAPRSETEPLPVGLSPWPVWPGSFGEVTHSS